MKTSNIRMIYTIFVFVALAAFDNIIIGLFPPLFLSIAKDLKVQVSTLGLVSGVNILVTTISSIYWGYLSGKFNRKRLIMIGTILWSASVYLTAHSKNFQQLFISQVLTGIGLGCIASIGFSVLTDYIPQKYRGMLLSLWGMAQGFGGIAGALMASLMAFKTSWRTPFEIVSIIGLVLVILYLFVKEPTLGESEPAVQQLIKEGHEYNFNIKSKHLFYIMSKRSNKLLFLQAFFFNITTGTLIWLPTLYISKIQLEGYDNQTAKVISGYLFALFQLGGLTSTFFGYLGDVFQRKSYKGRALLTAFLVFIMMPIYITMFLIPMDHLSLPSTDKPLVLLFSLLKQIFVNPWMAGMFVLALLSSSAQSGNTPNWLALITDVNLPEHRGTAFSIANLANGLGRTIGNVGVGILLAFVSARASAPENYIITLSIFQLFVIPSALCYMKMADVNVRDIKRVNSTLRKRVNKKLN